MRSRHPLLWFVTLLWSALMQCAPSLATAADRPASQQEYWAQIERRDWDQAILEAEKLVEAARPNSNDDPAALAEVLVLLGSAQLASRNYVAAESAYSEALQILQPRVVPTSDKLLEPLRGMGYTLAYAGKHEQAIPYMERALLVSRRTHGVLNINQQGILRQLATSQAKVGKYIEAEQHMQYLVRVGQQTYGAQDPRMADIFDALGDFYLQAGLATAARDAYRRALYVTEKKLGRDALATVQPLRSYADSYRSELLFAMYGIRDPSERLGTEPAYSDGRGMSPRHLNSEGERALLRAIKTLDSHPTRSTAVLFNTLLDLGDWYMTKGLPEEAMPQYRRAAALLDQVEPEHAAASQTKLSFPAQLYYPVPSAATRNLNRAKDELDERFVHLAFTVNVDGSVADVRVVEENASDRHVNDTLTAIRSARYRPKFVNGEPVTTNDVSLRQVFKLRRDRETE
jgi:tetratricopeptide (TPR) repeat protein